MPLKPWQRAETKTTLWFRCQADQTKCCQTSDPIKTWTQTWATKIWQVSLTAGMTKWGSTKRIWNAARERTKRSKWTFTTNPMSTRISWPSDSTTLPNQGRLKTLSDQNCSKSITKSKCNSAFQFQTEQRRFCWPKHKEKKAKQAPLSTNATWKTNSSTSNKASTKKKTK